jgi:hypothetical protein
LHAEGGSFHLHAEGLVLCPSVQGGIAREPWWLRVLGGGSKDPKQCGRVDCIAPVLLTCRRKFPTELVASF